MKIRNHKLEGVEFQQARWIGRAITPEIVILHDTASPLTKGNSAAYLRDNNAKVSVHFVIERDGTIQQQVPTNRQANHAGKSSYHGRSDCNGFSIGIELVNPGKMTVEKAGARGWWGALFEWDIYDLAEVTTPEHGAGAWMHYSVEQIRALTALLEALFAGIPALKDITTHWYVSPGRKVDTNPLFPLEHIRAKVLGRHDPAEVEAEEASEEVDVAAGDLSFGAVRSTSGLNMRRWPSFNPNVILTIPNGAVVHLLRVGEFDGRGWLRVLYAGQEGWVVGNYIELLK